MRYKKLLFALMIFLIPFVVPVGNNYETVQPQSEVVVADDLSETYVKTISPGDDWWVYITVSGSTGFYGDFTTTGNDISFYFVNQANFDLWDAGESFYVRDSVQDVYDYSYEEIVPSGTWYFVFSNRDSLFSTTSLTYHFYRDDTPPTINMNLDSGATYTGIKEITATLNEAKFDIGSVILKIDGTTVDTETDSSFSYSWNTANFANGDHTIALTVSDNVGNSDTYTITVYTSNAEAPTTNPDGSTDGYTNTSTPMSISTTFLFLFIGLIAVIGIIAVVKRKGGNGAVVGAQPTVPPPDSEGTKTIITQQVLLVCPFCGGKNEQGMTECAHCGAKQ